MSREAVILELYQDFSCMAGACPSTCCSGWKIVVDQKAYERFSALEPAWLRDRILENIITIGDMHEFRHRPGGDCAMLEKDGLCTIQKHAGEEALCNTCRKFPRLIGEVCRDGQEQTWISMAASCPVVAGYLWRGEGEVCVIRDHGRSSLAQTGWFAPYRRKLEALLEESVLERFGRRIQYTYDLAERVADLLVRYPERKYLPGSLDFYEQEMPEIGELAGSLLEFEEAYGTEWKRFVLRYFDWRMFTLTLEDAVHTETMSGMKDGKSPDILRDADRIHCAQTFGELKLLFTILFSRFAVSGSLTEPQILEAIDWVYRLCAHGKVLSRNMTQIFINIFEL